MIECLGLNRTFIPLSLRLLEHFSSGDGEKMKSQMIRKRAVKCRLDKAQPLQSLYSS